MVQQGEPEHHQEHHGHHLETQKYSIKNLRRCLQIALQVEHFILPPYVTAWSTIKNTPINSKVRKFIQDIALQEFLHMSLVANILNAVDGKPDMSCGALVPKYPSNVPGGLLPNLVMPIEKMSIELTRKKFMEFEIPEVWIMEPNLSFSTSLLPQCETKLQKKYCSADTTNTDHTGLDGFLIEYHKHTIGKFYRKIICEMVLLECAAHVRNSTIFTGNSSKQVVESTLGLINITNLHSAVSALETVTHQGEGADLCIPYQTSDIEKLPHYYRFKAIYKGHGIEYYNHSRPPWICHGVRYVFNGSLIPFNSSEVWNMVPNPIMTMYPEGSKVRQKAEEFNGNYTLLLHLLDKSFNGHPDQIGSFVRQMSIVQSNFRSLIQTPILAGPYKGFTGGPTFDCVESPKAS